MWRISLLPDGGNNIIPADDGTSDITSEVIMPKFLANSIYECETTGQLIHFYHATMGYPVVSTWCKAIDAGYFRGWPSLTSKRVRKFIKVVSETEMGHMDQRKVGVRSTKVKPEPEPDSMEYIPQTPLNDKTHHVYMSIAEVEGKLYSDQTGRFPITSNRGNCYVIIFFCRRRKLHKIVPDQIKTSFATGKSILRILFLSQSERLSSSITQIGQRNVA